MTLFVLSLRVVAGLLRLFTEVAFASEPAQSASQIGKSKNARKAAKAQRTRKVFLCGTFAALRLCVNAFSENSKSWRLLKVA